MAVQLQIDISDAEQAKLTEIVDTLLPGKTAGEVKTLLENQAKKLLFEDIKKRIRQHRGDEMRQSESVIRSTEDSTLVPMGEVFT